MLRRLIRLTAFLGLLVVVHSNEPNEGISKGGDLDQTHVNSLIDMAVDQYQSMYYHQARRGGKGKWSNGVGGLPSPRVAKKHVVTLVQSDPENKLFGSVSLKSYIRFCVELVNQFPRMHHGVGGGILIAIHSYQEEEHTIVRGFCTEAGTMYFFRKEMESLIRESSKPNSLIPPLTKSLFDQYDAGGNWDDFVENCEDLINEHKERVLRIESSSRWSAIGFSEISDFCEEVSDDIYPNYAQSLQEWNHIYALQNYIIERKGEMGSPIIGIPEKKPEYYVAGRHQSSMYRKCLRALWDMFQYDEDVDLKISGRNQYETLRSFCDAAKRYYTKSGRISSSPMISIGEPPRKRRHSSSVREEGGLVEQILEKQRDKELRERVLTVHMRKKLERQREERIKRRREIRKKTRKEPDVQPGTSSFPLEGIFSPGELPETIVQEESFPEQPPPMSSEAGESSKDQVLDDFGVGTANQEFEQLT